MSATVSSRSGEGRTRRRVKIRNLKGLHARASAKFVKCAEGFDAKVEVIKDGQSVLATSIMGLMMLAAGPGCMIELIGSGRQAEMAVEALAQLVGCGFDEECVSG